MTNQAEAGKHRTSFLQQTAGDEDAKLAALQPVLEKLKSLDPKTFGATSGIMNQAEAGAHGTSVLQQPTGDANAKLAALQPVLEKLKNLDLRTSAPSAAS